VFDLCNKESFQNIPSWIKEIEKNVGLDIKIMVFANKSDVTDPEELQVTEEDIKAFVEEYKIPVIRTSARTGDQVDSSFLDMTKSLIMKKNEEGQSQVDDRKKNMGLAFKRLQLGKEGAAESESSLTKNCC
jgi:GTPase SAR1 family protein